MSEQENQESRLPPERPYGFRQRLAAVHRRDRRDPEVSPAGSEVAVGDGWSVVVGREASEVVLTAAQDLQDYLLVSMNEPVAVRRVDDLVAAAAHGVRSIVLATVDDLPQEPVAGSPGACRIDVRPDRVVVCGADERAAAQGVYVIEDRMNLREAPHLRLGESTRTPVFSPRMTHSGWGLDEYPDAYLSAIAHAGMDSILVFVTGVDETPDERTHVATAVGPRGRYRDLNDLVARAARYGLDVYFYAYFDTRGLPHPSAPDAEERYAATYGAVFEACPGARGIVLVGESIEFPSKDPHTTGRHRLQDGGRHGGEAKPSPGWWPCTDYPEWLALVRRVVRRRNRAADIVFWTYNWGYAPEPDRLALIEALPDDVSLLVTFEMFEPIERAGVTETCVDYTASFVGPGRYFRSEARAAHERGLRLYAMANTGGLTWDFGVVPYEPVPYQWARRHRALREAKQAWGLTGLMESHHYGWWPSVLGELAKNAYTEPAVPAEQVCETIARREFGADAAALVLDAWREWSQSIEHYVPTNEDQYGPFRVGPSYPLVFGSLPRFPGSTHAMFGERIFRLDYRIGLEDRGHPPGPVRVPKQIASLEQMLAAWDRGLQYLSDAVGRTPAANQEAALRMHALGAFIRASIVTTIHVKQWWLAKLRLQLATELAAARAVLDEMVGLARREIANVRSALPLVEADSRLGWEPSMGYVCGPVQVRWKLDHLQRVVDTEIPAYQQRLSTPL